MQTESTSAAFQERPLGFRHSLLRNLVLLVMVTCGAILAVTIIGARQTVKDLSRSVTKRTADLTESELREFFEPIAAQLAVVSRWGEYGEVNLADAAALNTIFIPWLQSRPQVSSLLVANENGMEYMLLRSGSEWLNRIVRVETWGQETRWTRLEDARTPVASWRENLDYDPRRRPWFRGAVETAEPGSIHWTEPYTFFTTKDPGITASRRWSPPGEGAPLHVVALDVLLEDISRFTTGLSASPNGVALVLDEEMRVLGLPRDERFSSPEALRSAVLTTVEDLGIPSAADAARAWEKKRESRVEAFRYTSMGEKWWAGVRPFPIDPKRRLWIAVLVPEADLLGEVTKFRRTVLCIAVGSLVVAVGMAIAMDHAFRRKVTRAVENARQLGQYTLVRKIGEGGMGSVYLARHAMLRRETAVKLLRPERMHGVVALERFEREVMLTSRLTHPNTISIFDFGRTAEGIFYYAMEYLRGVDLDTLVKKTGALPPGRLIHILLQTCGSLAEAHSIGLIHRDIKPPNIMLSKRGGADDVVKVLDFGLAKEIGPDVDSGLTSDHTITGTPLYMSPESIRAPQEADARSDIYSLGAVSYFLLTGRRVFEADSVAAVCSMHLSTPPTPPSERLGSAVPSDLEAVILQCLEKDPAARPASALALASMLESAQDAGSWAKEDARRWWEKHASLLEEDGAKQAAGTRSAPATVTVELQSRTL